MDDTKPGSPAAEPQKKKNAIRRFFSILGPGVITGAADDDPSGIATYSVSGAQLGTAMLWMSLLTWPLMAAVQTMCARIGMVTGEGLAGALRKKFPRPLILMASFALLIANTINIGADLSGMADAGAMMTGVDSHILVVVFGVAIAFCTVYFRYYQIANTLKWLALALVAYIITGFIVKPDWSAVAHDTFVPSIPWNKAGIQTIVAILGTTISPYLFFWQASQEVEEEKAMGRRMLIQREGATRQEFKHRKIDIGIGTFFTNIVMFFITLTTAMTLHRAGITEINSSREAAEALRPLAGPLAYTLYTLGILGVGFLAIPTLSGSAAYAFAETFEWRQGLDEKLGGARAFYAVVVLSTVVGIALDFADVNPIRALYLTAVVNGFLAPFLLVGALVVACDPVIMKGQCSSRLGRAVVAATAAIMFAALIALFVV